MRETIVNLTVGLETAKRLVGMNLQVELLDSGVVHIYHDPETDKEAKILLKMKELEEIFDEQKELHYRSLASEF